MRVISPVVVYRRLFAKKIENKSLCL